MEEPLTRRALRQQREQEQIAQSDPPVDPVEQETLSFDDLLRDVEPEPVEELDTDTETKPQHAVAEKKRRGFKRLSFLGILQEVLLIVAFLGALFAVWYLWGDDWLRGQEDNQQSAELSEQWASPASDDALGWLGGTDIPVTASSRVNAETYATMMIPRFGADYVRTVANGTDRPSVLNEGWLGHYDQSQDVGEIGNFALAGHRTTYGAPLREIDSLNLGDPITIQTKDGWYVYRVTDKRVTSPQDIATIYPVPDGDGTEKPLQRWLTLTACHPLYSAAERYIAHAIFDRFIPNGQAVPTEVSSAPDSDNTIYVTTNVPEVIQTEAAPAVSGDLPDELEGGEE